VKDAACPISTGCGGGGGARAVHALARPTPHGPSERSSAPRRCACQRPGPARCGWARADWRRPSTRRAGASSQAFHCPRARQGVSPDMYRLQQAYPSLAAESDDSSSMAGVLPLRAKRGARGAGGVRRDAGEESAMESEEEDEEGAGWDDVTSERAVAGGCPCERAVRACRAGGTRMCLWSSSSAAPAFFGQLRSRASLAGTARPSRLLTRQSLTEVGVLKILDPQAGSSGEAPDETSSSHGQWVPESRAEGAAETNPRTPTPADGRAAQGYDMSMSGEDNLEQDSPHTSVRSDSFGDY